MATTAPSRQTGAAPYRWRWVALFVVLAAEIMDVLDSTVVNIAAPSIRRSMGTGYTTIQWITAGYTLAMAVGLITGGRLGDIVGRRRMFMLGAAGFVAGSLLCAVAQSPDMLIASRVLQGAFGAVMIPQGLGIIKGIFPASELAAAFSAFGPVIGLAAVAGPLVAGALIDADPFGTGWRMIFLINLPLGLLALAGAARFFPESKSGRSPRLDLPGMLLATGGAVLLVYPLVQGRDAGWPAWTWVSMAAALPVFAAFAAYERRTERSGGSPLVEPSVFRQRAFSGGLVVCAAFFAAMSGFMLVFSVFVQVGLGWVPMRAGLAAAPWALGIAIGSAAAGAVLAQKFGRRVLHAGLLVMTAGLAGLYLVVGHFGLRASLWDFAPVNLVTGIGMGLLVAPMFDIILAGVEGHEVGSASGVLNAVQQLGSSIGVALLGTVFFDRLAATRGQQFTGALHLTIWVAAALYVVTFASAFLLPHRARPVHPEEQQAAPQVSDADPVNVGASES